jgi:putative inorganic carbon (HCO3(-)) transporter
MLWLGTLACAASAAAGLLPLPRRIRLIALSGALVLGLCLVVADNWDSDRLVEIRDSPFALAAAASAAAFGVAVLALLLHRRPRLLPLLLVAAMPFRIPVDLGGSSANLLVPLYVVIAAGLLASLMAADGGKGNESGGNGPLRLTRFALAAILLLYGLQAGYADDLSPALRNVAFFLVPFAALFALLAESEWDAAALRAVVMVLAAEGVVFALVGGLQYVTRDVPWNDKVIAGNEAHAYFRVNSLFFDPNILGRYLVVTMTVLATIVAFGRRRGEAIAASAVYLLLLILLVVTFSQSSMIALIGSVLVLVALRFGVITGLAAAAGSALVVLASLALIGGGGVSEDTSGRSGLIDGGLEIAGDAPLQGAGSGSFPAEFRERFGGGKGAAVESHTEPVTVLAEQGAVGILAYAALLAITIAGLVTAAGPSLRLPARGPPLAAALCAAYAAMILHSLGYAAFLTDPLTWAVLAIASATLVPATSPLRAPEARPEPV